jgi:predicted molibdopterin-dependent oxidoreductase YjgC
VILPAANTVEEDGSFINRDGRVQRYQQAKSAPGMARPAWWILAELLREMGEGDGADTAAHAFDMIGRVEKDFEGLSYEAMGFRGQMLATAGAVSG